MGQMRTTPRRGRLVASCAVTGFLLPGRAACPLAVIVPAASFALTGMPPMTVPPTGPIMMLELAFLMAANRFLHSRLKIGVFPRLRSRRSPSGCSISSFFFSRRPSSASPAWPFRWPPW